MNKLTTVLDTILIPEWRAAWRLYSIKISAAVAIISSALLFLEPIMPQLAPFLPSAWTPSISLAFAIARLLKQKSE